MRNPSSHHKHCHHHQHYVTKYFIIRRVLWSISELVVIKGILTLSFIQLLRSLTPFFGDANIFDSCDRTLVYPEIKYMISQYISYCLVRTQRLIANKKNLVNKVVHWEACKRNGWLSGQHDLQLLILIIPPPPNSLVEVNIRTLCKDFKGWCSRKAGNI